MNIIINKEPFTYIVIEDWLPDDINQKMYQEILRLIPHMRPSVTSISNNTNDVGKLVKDNSLKSSQNLWLYSWYDLYPHPTFDLGKEFEKQLWCPEVKQALKDTNDALFRQMLYTDTSQLLLSKYELGDHYNWHRDYNDTITINYFVGKEPHTWKGGDFEFGGWEDTNTSSVVPFKNNTLIMFPSRVYHRVTPITNYWSPPGGARFTLQYWGKLKYVTEG
jgi:hypothetical protein